MAKLTQAVRIVTLKHIKSLSETNSYKFKERFEAQDLVLELQTLKEALEHKRSKMGQPLRKKT